MFGKYFYSITASHSMSLKCKSIVFLLVHGYWATWGNWGECSATCNSGGTRKRTRTCTNPAPMNGGDDCDSAKIGSLQTESCNTKIICPGLYLNGCKLPDQMNIFNKVIVN